MLPRGAAYLRLNGLLRIAQRLEVDCVPAVTGFDLKQAATIPLLGNSLNFLEINKSNAFDLNHQNFPSY